MCDTALSFTRDHLLPLARDHLLPVLKEAANMIRGVPKDVEELKDELENIQKFINDADRIAGAEEDNTRHGIRAKIMKLIEASFLIEDVIEEYMMREEQQPGDNPGCVAGATDFLKTMTLRLQIAYKVQNIKSQISEIKDTSGKDYAFQEERATSSSAANRDTTTILLQNLRDAPLYMDEADVVGFDVPRDHLIDLLLMGRPELTIVSVVAMGGQGKTTLAKKVFDSTRVTEHFDYCVWITVSESYTIEVLLRNLLQELYKKERRDPPKEILEMGPRALRDEVRNYLLQKRYVIVFDDVWNIPFWADIEFALIDNNNQSRILITSRNIEVVMSCKRSSFVEVYKLQPLTLEKSLELFNKKAFRNLNGCCPNNLMVISSKIVEKCNGLPLAIVVIGGLLSGKDIDAIHEWKKFSESMSLELKEHSQLIQIRKILGFSYHDLSYDLKSCLLYFGMYPEDYIVNSRNLIRQWIDEGFVKEKTGKTLEEVGEGYLMELIHRSLVQVSSTSIDGRAKTCRVHDLIHMMILEKFDNLKFCRIHSEAGQSSLSGIIRRLSLTTKSNDLPEIFESSHVPSLLIFTRISSMFRFKRIFTKYKMLKVLAFENSTCPTLPKNLGSLIQLKYLAYGRLDYKTKTLTSSIGMLQNLDTLDLRGVTLSYMPKEIMMLKKLRHLLGRSSSWIQLKDGIGGMRSLQTLERVHLDDHKIETIELVKELGQLEQLRKLSLLWVSKIHEIALISSTNKMQQLEKLYIWCNHEQVIDFDMFSPSPMLRSLTLIGRLEKLPVWIPKLENLVKLRLSCSKLTKDPMKSLQNMQNLLYLSITSYAYEGKILHFEEGGFQNLKELYLEDSDSLRSIVIDKGALPSLKKLSLNRIPRLTFLPTCFKHLKTLELLRIGPLYEISYINALRNGIKNGTFQHLPFLKVNIVKVHKWNGGN